MARERESNRKGPKGDAVPSRKDSSEGDLAHKSDNDLAPKSLLAYQRTAGNAATTALIQRFDKGGDVKAPSPQPWVKAVPGGGTPPAPPPWVKGVVPGSTEQKSPSPQPWVKGVLPKAPPPPPPRTWAKASPSPSVVPTSTGMAGQRDPATIAAQGALSLAATAAKGAALSAVTSAQQGATDEATATKSATRVEEIKKTSGVRLAMAKGFWPSDEPFAGAQAAKQAEAVDVLKGEGDKRVVDAGASEQSATKAEQAAAAAAGAARIAKGAGALAAATLGPLAPKDVLAAIDLAVNEAEAAEAQAAKAAKGAAAQHLLGKTTLGDVTKTQTDVWQPMKLGGGPAVIVGRLQQQLNATRAKGAARISITGAFTAPTEGLLKAFQTAPTGLADSATWDQLDKKAPAVRQAGEWVVLSQEGHKTMGESWKGNAHFEGMEHPFIVPKVTDDGWYAVDKGPAVRELQQRLNNWPRPKAVKLVVDGVYGRKTQAVVQAFQGAKGIAVSTTVDKATWAALDTVAGPVTGGLVQHQELTEVEGQERGQTIRYAWKVSGNDLKISVRMKFVHADPYAYDLVEPLKKDKRNPKKYASSELSMLKRRMSSAQQKWLSDITRVWNGFSAKDVAPKSTNRPLRITFEPIPVSSGEDATIEIVPGAHADNTGGRSDSAHWFASDEDAGLAPHEFGHLVGLPDEYSRREEAQAATTGTEPNIGDVDPVSIDSPLDLAQDLAASIQNAPDVADAGDPADPLKKGAVESARGKLEAVAERVSAYGLRGDSGFARSVSEQFATDPTCAAVSGGKGVVAYVVDLVNGLPLDQADDAERTLFWALQTLYEAPVRPFLASNESIMGSMGAVPTRDLPMPSAGHDHPVQPRHLTPYLKHIALAKGGTWEIG